MFDDVLQEYTAKQLLKFYCAACTLDSHRRCVEFNGKTTELAHCQYFAHGRDSRQAEKVCKNFWDLECRKRGIELLG